MWSEKSIDRKGGKIVEQKTLLIRFTGEKELELYEWLRREKFETGLPMAEIIRQALEMFREKKEEKQMRTWVRNGYKVVEVEFDYDLHQFEVVRDNGEIIATITPFDLDDQNDIIEALDAGQGVEGWEDGMGNTITI
jgi:uncharacterized protein YkuJ